MSSESTDLLWWVVPGEIAGMPIPYISQERRSQRGGALNDFDDELPVLYAAGVRSVVCLLNIPSDVYVYEAAGFAFLSSNIPNYYPPEMDQAFQICEFIKKSPKAVAVHCEGGIGRTGTIIACYLVQQGMVAEEAIKKVRECEPTAIETKLQEDFLLKFEEAT